MVLDDGEASVPGRGPRVHRQSRLRFLRPATGVAGAESLSSSDEDESRLSPVRGALGRGELSNEEKALRFCDGDCGGERWSLLEAGGARESRSTFSWAGSRMMDDSMSEWAKVYLTVVTSSSSGVRKETCLAAGNIGRVGPILRDIIDLAGLFARMEITLCGCLYGRVRGADSVDADVSADETVVDAELGVVAALFSCGWTGVVAG